MVAVRRSPTATNRSKPKASEPEPPPEPKTPRQQAVARQRLPIEPGRRSTNKAPPAPKVRPRERCIKLTRNGRPCKHYQKNARTKLCPFHWAQESGLKRRSEAQDDATVTPTQSGVTRAGITTKVKRKFKSVELFVVNEQAQKALTRLGMEPTDGFDPKTALLSLVESSWRQQRVWEAMLSSIPQEDWAQVGVLPLPGLQYTARGARIEAIQKYLGEATKTAAKISSLAISSGIEERIVRLAEEQSALIADTVRAGLIAGISALAQQGLITSQGEAAAIEAALQSAATHLRALATGNQPEIIEGVHEIIDAPSKTQSAAVRAQRLIGPSTDNDYRDIDSDTEDLHDDDD